MVRSWIPSNVHIHPLPPNWNLIFFYSPVTWTFPYLALQIPTSASSLTCLSFCFLHHPNARPQQLLLDTSSELTLYKLPWLHTAHLAPAQCYDLISYHSPSHLSYSSHNGFFLLLQLAKTLARAVVFASTPPPQSCPILAWMVSSYFSDPSLNIFTGHSV